MKPVEYSVSGEKIHDPFEFGIPSRPGIIVFYHQTNFTYITGDMRTVLQYVIEFIKSSTARAYFSLVDCASYPDTDENVPLGSRKEGSTDKGAITEDLQVSWYRRTAVDDVVDNFLCQSGRDMRRR